MLKLRVSPQKAAERLAKCHGCKFYKAATGTCGPPVIGRKLTTTEANEAGLLVSHYRKKYRLCGCVVKAKVQFHLSRCPVGFWEREALTERDAKTLRTIIDHVRKAGRASHSDVAELFAAKSKMLGVKIPPQTCPQCVRDLMNEMDHALKGFDDNAPEVEPPISY